jgi:hypothetical protein
MLDQGSARQHLDKWTTNHHGVFFSSSSRSEIFNIRITCARYRLAGRNPVMRLESRLSGTLYNKQNCLRVNFSSASFSMMSQPSGVIFLTDTFRPSYDIITR